jgi:hypothetical protein
MLVLGTTESITTAATTYPHPGLRDAIALRVQFFSDQEEDELGEVLKIVTVESSDTLPLVDQAIHGLLTGNPWSGKKLGDPGFQPPFETFEEHATFYDMTFIEGGGGGCTVVLIPKQPGLDPDLLSLCIRHATPAPESAP